MTETRQIILFALCLLTFFAALGALTIDFKILDQYRTDHQTISTLRADKASLTKDLNDTSRALDEMAIKAARYEDEIHRLETQARLAPKSKGRSL